MGYTMRTWLEHVGNDDEKRSIELAPHPNLVSRGQTLPGTCRAGASGPAGPVLAGPFRRLRGVSRHTPSFYNIAMRSAYSRLVRARRSGHAVKMPTIAIEQKKEWTRESKKK